MQNIYDQEEFFGVYSQMARSRDGLTAAGEWESFRNLIPNVTGARVLDLGCGYGWHSAYLADQGAMSILSIDGSQKMINKARQLHPSSVIDFQYLNLGQYDYPEKSFDLVISNLVFHYMEDLEELFQRIFRTLKTGGTFLFNMEHPVFTAGVNQEWLSGVVIR